MNDKEFYDTLDELFSEIMSQAGGLVFQHYGRLNDVLMEVTERRKAANARHGLETEPRPLPDFDTEYANAYTCQCGHSWDDVSEEPEWAAECSECGELNVPDYSEPVHKPVTFTPEPLRPDPDENPRYTKWRQLYPDAPAYEFSLWIRRKLSLAVRDREPFTSDLCGGVIIEQAAWTDYLLSQED